MLLHGASSFIVPTGVTTRSHSNVALDATTPKTWSIKQDSSKFLASNILATSIAFTAASAAGFAPTAAIAYDQSDYASDTVQETVKALKDSTGNVDATFKTYESIASIVTEGKGVGGMINYRKLLLSPK